MRLVSFLVRQLHLRSAATPAVLTHIIEGQVGDGIRLFQSKERGCPIPPAAPTTVTLTMFNNKLKKRWGKKIAAGV